MPAKPPHYTFQFNADFYSYSTHETITGRVIWVTTGFTLLE